MQSFELHLISYSIILFGISINSVQLDNAKRTAKSLKMLHGGCEVLYFFENGIAQGTCFHSEGKNAHITVNGMDVTKEVTTWNSSNAIYFQIQLSRKTLLGNYLCHGDKDYPLHRIGYILCDPREIVPAKVCPKGQFCVISGSSTSCQERIDCGMHNSATRECLSGQLGKPTNDPCHANSITQELPNDYYLEYNPRTSRPCSADPRVMHNGSVIKYRSTIPISSSHELERHKWNRVGNLSISSGHCKIYEKNYNMTFNQSDFSAAWDGNLPSKVSVCCKTMGNDWIGPDGSTIFYMIFYNKNRTRFRIEQKCTNSTIDITNTTNQEFLLDPTTILKCIVSIDGGLFIEAFSMEANATGQPKPGSDSVEMKYNGDPNALYTCFAKVYFYEYFGGIRFKPLYTEKRDFMIYHSTTSANGTSATTTTAKTMAGEKAIISYAS